MTSSLAGLDLTSVVICCRLRKTATAYRSSPGARPERSCRQPGKGAGANMKRVYVKEEVCMGCRLCEVHCRLEHSRSRDIIKAFTRESPRPVSRVRVESRHPVSFSVRCQHCEHPACVYSCLAGAISRDPETGAVVVDEERCAGCWTCLLACPFGAIMRDTARGRTAKCDLCPGADTPACVANCPNEALSYEEAAVTDLSAGGRSAAVQASKETAAA